MTEFYKGRKVRCIQGSQITTQLKQDGEFEVYSESESYLVIVGIPGMWSKSRFVPLNTQPATTERPPLGLRPRYIVDGLRIQEILVAMTTFASAGKQIPQAWITELDSLNSAVVS